MTVHIKLALLACGVVLVLGLGALAFRPLVAMSDKDRVPPARVSIPPLGVLGDSDSHAYQDRIRFSKRPDARGGAFRSSTFQWTEVLHRLRPHDIDPGMWGTWGTRGIVATALRVVGLPGRTPKKEDYQYNFAISGSVCSDLVDGAAAQRPQLLQLMRQNPVRWNTGLVVIRIGMNDFGHQDSLDRLAEDPADAVVIRAIDSCVRTIRETVLLIRRDFLGVKIVLVGIFDNTNWARHDQKWRSPQEIQNIRSGLDRFDNALRSIANSDAAIAFFDDREWFAKHWGGRDVSGAPAYRAVRLDGGFEVTNSEGDDPSNATLADGHAGLVWNALWAQEFVDLVNTRFGLRIPTISSAELSTFVDFTVSQNTLSPNEPDQHPPR
jgi:hypothetical protein